MSGPGVEWSTQSATPVAFCNLCQLVLSNGTPHENAARVVEYHGRKYIFCSEPCAWIFSREPDRYADHKGVVNRMLAGEAPANVVKLTRTYFEVTPEVRGKDMLRGRYPWLRAHRNEPG
jgi:toluene monooxygenase system protein A